MLATLLVVISTARLDTMNWLRNSVLTWQCAPHKQSQGTKGGKLDDKECNFYFSGGLCQRLANLPSFLCGNTPFLHSGAVIQFQLGLRSERAVKDLVKNPLGIVALFISLIYSIANLLLGATASTLSADERHPLILFIVFFPVLVLGVFYFLVSRHHGKLYAPGDYKDDKSFLRTLSPEEQETKIQREVSDAIPQGDSALSTEQSRSISSVPNPVRTDYVELRREIERVELSVVKRFEKKLNAPAERNLGIGDTGVTFDALFTEGVQFTALEVKLLRSPMPTSIALDRALYAAVVAEKFFEGRFRLLLVVVYDFEIEELARVKSFWERRVHACPAKVELEFISKADL